MRYYPVFLDIQDRPCLVVGGGAVGTRKVKTLMDCGGRVTVVSPMTTPELTGMAQNGRLTLKRRTYRSADLEGLFLVIGATDDEALNQQIQADARNRNLLCNIADRPKACNFILPAIVQRDDLVIAISTSGKSPALAKKLRKELEIQFGVEYAEFLHLMGAIRKQLLSREHEPEIHKPLFEKLIAEGLLEMVKARRTDAINTLLKDTFGKEYTFESLMQQRTINL
jgi:precorrin-2 dehydrogenase/sirohydrochlorin ferrochelatase